MLGKDTYNNAVCAPNFLCLSVFVTQSEWEWKQAIPLDTIA